MSARTSWLLTFVLLAVIVGKGTAGAASPALSLQPTTGPPTTTIVVTGAGFEAGESVEVTFDAKTVVASADPSGAFSTTIRVPRAASAGGHDVTATGETSSLVASATFTVVLPSIALSRTVGPPTVDLTVTGANFPSGEAIVVAFDSKTVAQVAADQTGAFAADIGVPRKARSGTYDVTATGVPSGLIGEATFTVRIDNWPQYGFDPAHSGVNPSEFLLDPSTVGDLTSAWTATIDPGGGPATAFSSPAVVKGVVFVGSEKGRIYALDAWTGKILWNTDAGSSHNWSSPAVVKGVVYIGGAGIFALRASTGTLLWKVNTQDDVGSLAVANGIVYGFSSTLYAIRTSDGSILWTKKTGDAGDSSLGQAPTVADGVVFIGSETNDLLALDSATGDVQWTRPMGEEAGTAPAVVDGVAYAPSIEHLRALDASTGEVLWTAPIGTGFSAPAVANGLVYVGGSDGLFAFDAATGAPVWNAPLGYCTESSPAVANGVVYVISNQTVHEPTGLLYALDALTGEVLWTALIEAETRPDPRVVNGMVYTGSEDGKVRAFALP
jgi:eukaryotic-like serine/threonine-protein kinase